MAALVVLVALALVAKRAVLPGKVRLAPVALVAPALRLLRWIFAPT